MTIETAMRDAEHKMDQALTHMKDDLAGIRTGRAAPAVLNRVTVEYYGTPVPLNQLAGVTVPEPRLLQVQPFDKSAIGAIEKAIMTSDLGITPNNDGAVIRLAFPELTEERRIELTKVAHVRAEEGRVAVRAARRHAKQELERMKKDGTLSEDEERGAEGSLQKLTDRYVGDVDENLKRKEAELSEV